MKIFLCAIILIAPFNNNISANATKDIQNESQSTDKSKTINTTTVRSSTGTSLEAGSKSDVTYTAEMIRQEDKLSRKKRQYYDPYGSYYYDRYPPIIIPLAFGGFGGGYGYGRGFGGRGYGFGGRGIGGRGFGFGGRGYGGRGGGFGGRGGGFGGRGGGFGGRGGGFGGGGRGGGRG